MMNYWALCIIVCGLSGYHVLMLLVTSMVMLILLVSNWYIELMADESLTHVWVTLKNIVLSMDSCVYWYCVWINIKR